MWSDSFGFGFSSGFDDSFGSFGSFGTSRRYNRGWTPHVDRNQKYRSTIRDTGKGSARNSDFVPRKSGDQPQTYEEVKQACLDSECLWEDPDFTADDSSIYYRNPPSVWPNIEWKRPHEICDDPELFVEGATRMDINQGILGDCWFLAAVASLAVNQRLLHRVVPDGQSFTDDYAGIFRFELWQYGRWVEVIIDDRLPTYQGKLIYMHSDERNEFWSALLEKAYAKINGTYESLSGGLASEAMTDLTGGVVMNVQLRGEAPPELLQLMLKARKRGSLMSCSIDATSDTMESRLDTGLIIGHAYSVTDIKLVDIETPSVSGKIPLVRVRNPWGDEHEWNGAWSDDSEEWQFIPEEQKEELGLTFDHDGEFWMSFNDFKEHFQRLEICYLGPDTLQGDDEGEVVDDIQKYEGTLNEGSWRRHVNAGGCRNYPSTFWTNPQYRVTIHEADDDDEEGTGLLIVGLMQKHGRKMRSQGKDNLTIGYAIYQLEDPNCGTLDKRFFDRHASAARSPAFINMREVSDFHKLPPGDYVVVPSTFEPNEETDFILRVFSEKKDYVKELDDDDDATQEEPEEFGEETEEEDFEEQIKQVFVDLVEEDGEISAYQVRDLLNEHFQKEFEFEGFSVDICRSMVAMSDADLSGKLNLDDFMKLSKDLSMCKRAFKSLDTDGNGYFNSYEFRRVLKTLATGYLDFPKGLRITNATFNAIVMRYSDDEGHVRFDDFVACVVKLKTLYQTFKAKDRNNSGSVEFKMDEFLQLSMYS